MMLASWSGAACSAAVCEARLDTSATGPAGTRHRDNLATDSTRRRNGGEAASEQCPCKPGKQAFDSRTKHLHTSGVRRDAVSPSSVA